MNRIRTYHWIVIAAMLSILLVWAIPTGALSTTSGNVMKVDANAARWLAQATEEESATFIVTMSDDGAQLQADQGLAIADKLTRRTHVYTVLSERSARNDAALQAFLKIQQLGNDVSAIHTYVVINGFSITANPRVIEALKGWERIVSIELDVPIQLDPVLDEQRDAVNAIEWNISKIGADRVQTELGINGTGVVVGNLDTGVRHTHEALSANYKCAGGSHTACWLDAISGQPTPYDDNDHGTHTMGTAVGSGGIGVAPGARWIACKAFNSSGSGSQTDILECFDWFLAPGGNAANAPDVVNNSWGNTNGSTTTYQQAVTNWVNAGIYPEFSNGNSGPSCSTVGAPASYTNAVGTGATDINDAIASFSSRGPSPFGVIKPDLSAPGVNIRSAGGSTDTEYRALNGTSMAGPHVTGLVALLLDADPSLTISQLTQNMKDNALGISATACSSSGIPNNVYGWGRIRAFESVQDALGSGPTPTPTPIATPTATPISTPTPTPTPISNIVFDDNFETNKGWTRNPNGTDTATTGLWERGDPQATNSSGPKQLGTTVSGVNDLVTGRLSGFSAGSYDIDGGTTSIRSPAITLPSSGNLTLSFSFYFSHLNNSSSADFFRVRIVGSTTTTVFEELGSGSDDDAVWTSTTVNLNAYAGQTIHILIEAADASTASLIEAAVDDVRITHQ